MTVNELIERLTDLAEEGFGEADIRLAQQPHWPFEFAIGEVEVVTPEDAGDPSEDGDGLDRFDEAVAYIGEGRQIGYLPGVASEALGWSDR